MYLCKLCIQPVSRNIVITGSTKGLGKAIAKKMFLDGNNVVINSRSKTNTLSTYREFLELSKLNPDCGVAYPISADVTSYDECERLMNTSLSNLGNIDIWINNAGVSTRENLINLKGEDIDSIIDTNLKGTLYCCNLLIPRMRENGIIINIEGAGSNMFATPGYSVYGSTKAGVTQFTKTLSNEYADKNICFCTLSPGMVITDLLLSNCTNNMKKAFNIFAETPEHIAEFSVNEIYKIKSNTSIQYLTITRIITLLILHVFRRHRVFDKDGNLK